jgi:hypothetical protein
MKRLDFITAAAMLLLAAAVIYETGSLAYWDDITPGSRFMPLWISAATIVLSGLLVLEAIRKDSDQPVDWPDPVGRARVALTMLAIFGFVALAPVLGFVAGAAAFVLVMLIGVLRRPILPSAFTAVVAAGIIHGVFVQWLSVALPKGMVGL